MRCLPISPSLLIYVIPFKFRPLGPLGWNVHLFSVFHLLTMFLHSHLHAVSKVSSPCFSLLREVSWLENEIDPNPVFKASWTLSVADVLCEQENGKPQSPHWNSWLLTVCLKHPLHLSVKGGGGCQTQKIYSAFCWCWEKVIMKNGEKMEDPSLLLPENMFNK